MRMFTLSEKAFYIIHTVHLLRQKAEKFAAKKIDGLVARLLDG